MGKWTAKQINEKRERVLATLQRALYRGDITSEQFENELTALAEWVAARCQQMPIDEIEKLVEQTK